MDYLTNYYKNLSEQLQERVNHLQKLLKENFYSEEETDMVPEVRHDAIVDAITSEHTKFFPHITKVLKGGKGLVSDREASVAHVREYLGEHPNAPFQSADDAIDALDKAGLVFNDKWEDAYHANKLPGGVGVEIGKIENDYLEELKHHVGHVVGGGHPSRGSHMVMSTTGRLQREAYESESNRRELDRINADRRAEGKPPFRTLDQALTHYEREDEKARRKKYS